LVSRQPATLIPPLSLHDALPISSRDAPDLLDLRPAHRLAIRNHGERLERGRTEPRRPDRELCPLDGRGMHRPGHDLPATPQLDQDRKSTRLNSSHVKTSYAVSCL